MIQTENATVYVGNNLDILPTLPDNSVDSIVTDPPYELGFMGKSWDSSGIAYNVDLWRECLRVLKPGGHLLSFGGTRTWHRIAVAIEDAGFEVRDSIAWMYGSGFPKSLDVSKAIDKLNGKPRPTKEFKDFLRAGKSKVGLTSEQIDKELGFTSAVFSPHYVGNNPQIEYPTQEKYNKLKKLLKLDDSFDYLIEWAEAEREVTGHYTQPAAADLWMSNYSDRVAAKPKEKKEKPSTPEAQQWEGWGTALKPAFEPVIVARKPLIGTVAANVLEHGTGALNVDGSRIGTEERSHKWAGRSNSFTQERTDAAAGMFAGSGHGQTTVAGRWPANVILDEYSAGLLDEQSGQTKSGNIKPHASNNTSTIYGNGNGFQPDITGSHEGDSGGASRFFYVAKASKRDRNEGLDELDTKQTTGGGGLTEAGGAYGSIKAPAKNFHPTVKPTALMRYLVKLVTPPGGTVLDPFTGSGSTGKAAILEGFRFIGCEMTEDYLPIIQGRLEHAEATAAAEKEKRDEALF